MLLTSQNIRFRVDTLDSHFIISHIRAHQVTAVLFGPSLRTCVLTWHHQLQETMILLRSHIRVKLMAPTLYVKHPSTRAVFLQSMHLKKLNLNLNKSGLNKTLHQCTAQHSSQHTNIPRYGYFTVQLCITQLAKCFERKQEGILEFHLNLSKQIRDLRLR